MAYDEVEALAARVRQKMRWFDRVLASGSLTERRMFGGVAFLIGGNVAIVATSPSRGNFVTSSLVDEHGSQAGLLLQVGPTLYDEMLARGSVAGKRVAIQGPWMRGWFWVERRDVGTDHDLAWWMDRGVHYARSLPLTH